MFSGLEPRKYKRPVGSVGKSLNLDDVDQNITDYLSKLYEHFIYMIRNQIGRAMFESITVQFVLTVPAIWSENAKQRTLEAFRQVPGLPSGYSATLVSEPEAAAVAAIRELRHQDLEVDDSFVVVDAGGGTVDLITYTITSLHPILEVVEAAEGTEHESLSVPMNGLARDEELGINGRGRLKLRPEELHMLFEPEILKVIQLVKEQIDLASVPIRKILLVGGFGSSTYLRERLQIDIGNGIEILQPPNSWAAVVNGAVLKGLALVRPTDYDVPKVKKKARTGRKHYGTEMAVAFKAEKHHSLYSRIFHDDMDGIWRVHAMEWFVKRGDLISEDRPFLKAIQVAQPVSSGRPRSIGYTVYADQSSDVAPLARNDDLQVLCRVTANLDHIPDSRLEKKLGADGVMYYVVRAQIEAVFQSALTEYTLIHNGQRYQTVKAEYV
ncbi:hypothetical protein Hte_007908 [Hypoxylon texense]